MPSGAPRKIVLHSQRGYHEGLEPLVAAWRRKGVRYVGVVGVDASAIEDAIDELCVGDGSAPYFMLTAFHGPGGTVQDAVALAESLSDEYQGGDVVVVDF